MPFSTYSSTWTLFMILPDFKQCQDLSTNLTYQDSECVPWITAIQVGIITWQKNNNSVRTLKFARLRIHREAHLINLWYSWKIGEITLWDFDTNKWRPHIATLRERKCHFAIWADSSRLHNRASSCILQIQLWQCSTHRIDWTTSASFTPWARKEACVHLLRSMT